MVCAAYTMVFLACISCMACVTGTSLVVLYFVLKNNELWNPNWETGAFDRVDVCPNADSSIMFTEGGSRIGFDAYTLAPEQKVGEACPVVAAAARPLQLTLTESHGSGIRKDANYYMVVYLPAGAYASMAVEVSDALGKTLLPTQKLFLGPDEFYPWTADGRERLKDDEVPFLVPPPSPPLPPSYPAGRCVDTCSTSKDGACDDGGPGSEFSVCARYTDCVDCGRRAASGRRLLFAGHSSSAVNSATSESVVSTNPTDLDSRPAPGSRRLLKGGGGNQKQYYALPDFRTKSGSGGRSSTAGAQRWNGRDVGQRTLTTGGSIDRYGNTYSLPGGRVPYYYASAVIPANYFAAIDSRSLEPNDSPSSSSSIHVPLDRYEPRPTFRTPVSDAEWPIAVKVRLAQLCPPCDMLRLVWLSHSV